VYANEWNQFARQTYQVWTGTDLVDPRDIRTVDYDRDIPQHDVLCAGFPCQPFSIAGVSKKNSMGRAHGFADRDQGNLFSTILDVVDAKRPPTLLLENVKHLVRHDRGNTWSKITSELRLRRYELRFEVIDARGWVPQHRERIFVVCFNADQFTREEIAEFSFPRGTGQRTLGSVLARGEVDPKYTLSNELWRYLRDYAAKHKAAGNGFGFRLVDRHDVSATLSARYYKDGSEILIRQPGRRNPRRLTPREAGLLMGFSPRLARTMGHHHGFPQVVSDSQAYRQLGNSVCPLVVEAIGRELVRVLDRRQRRLRCAA
jgi:DNA (cytosine-5)-methyltransferase 1